MSNELAQKANTVLMLQVVISLLVAATFYIYQDAWFAYSAIYGGLISMLLVMLLQRGFNRASDGGAGAKAGEIALYLGAAIRFVLVLILFGLGMAVLKLEAMAIVISFGLTQLAFALANARTSKHADNGSEER